MARARHRARIRARAEAKARAGAGARVGARLGLEGELAAAGRVEVVEKSAQRAQLGALQPGQHLVQLRILRLYDELSEPHLVRARTRARGNPRVGSAFTY